MAGEPGRDEPARLRAHAEQIALAAIDAADAGRAVREHVALDGDIVRVGDSAWPLPAGRLLVAGAGKAAAVMAAALEQSLGARISDGLVIVPHGVDTAALSCISAARGGHPLPDSEGIEASSRLLAQSRQLGADDGLVVLLSGGASSLFEVPVDGVGLGELRELGELLLTSGAPIEQVNQVRRAVSRVKGGGLAAAAYPARVLTLAVSDVVGDQPAVIGSGPTAAGASDATATEVLSRYGLAGRLPHALAQLLDTAAAPAHGEDLSHVTNAIIASNRTAVEGACAAARQLGYQVTDLGIVVGEARCAAEPLWRRARAGAEPCCFVAGGETTVTVRGRGTGGRNQELALSMALLLDGRPAVCFASVGTDGVDGPTGAAGAIVDGGTAGRARALGLDPDRALEDNDSNPLLAATRDLLVTGPTRTNVMDVQILLRSELQ